MSLSHPDPVEQVYHSITSTLQTIGAVASPSSDVKLQHMSGPIMIVRIYYMLFESENGWKLALWFSVILNVNLAILNMLPIPVLDGGHIVLAIIESVPAKTGKHEDPGVGPNCLRHAYHRLHALHYLLRYRGFAWQEQRPEILPEGIASSGESGPFTVTSAQGQAVNYCDDPYRYQRRATREVMVGRVGIGGANPIRVQSMITCDTMDTEASIAQTMELAEAGCEIVRITAPTVKDAANLQNIVRGLRERGCEVPIVADIHFKPEAAMEAAKWVEKVRINPGQLR